MCEGFYENIAKTISKLMEHEAYVVSDKHGFCAILQNFDPHSPLLKYIDINDDCSNLITQHRDTPHIIAHNNVNYNRSVYLNGNDQVEIWTFWHSNNGLLSLLPYYENSQHKDTLYFNPELHKHFSINRDYVKSMALKDVVNIDLLQTYLGSLFIDTYFSREWVSSINIDKFVSTQTKTLLLKNNIIRGPFKMKKDFLL